MAVTEFSIKDYSKEVLSAFKEQAQTGLDSIGEAAEGYAKGDCPVDSGRARNSITYITRTSQGKPNEPPQGEKLGTPAEPKDYKAKSKPEEYTVYIGSNVEYLSAIEFRDVEHRVGKAHFLKNAASTHGEEYKEIMRAALKD